MVTAQQHWIYHERQEAQLCGQHALNNLVQQNAFSPGDLAEIADQLDQMELNYMAQNNEGGVSSKDYLKRMAEGSGNVDESGNFSIEVLRSALLTRFGMELPNIKQEGVGDKIDITDLDGFVS
jgi:ataxin-3